VYCCAQRASKGDSTPGTRSPNLLSPRRANKEGMKAKAVMMIMMMVMMMIVMLMLMMMMMMMTMAMMMRNGPAQAPMLCVLI
jgi:hypothetical protein